MSMRCTAHIAAESRSWRKRDAGEAFSRITHPLSTLLHAATAPICTRSLCFAVPQPASPPAMQHAHTRKTCTEPKHFGARNANRKAVIVLDNPASTTITVVWQGFRRLLQGPCAVQVNGRVRGVPVSFRREFWTARHGCGAKSAICESSEPRHLASRHPASSYAQLRATLALSEKQPFWASGHVLLATYWYSY